MSDIKKKSISTKTQESEAPATPSPQKNDSGFLLNAANWLLSRLPWFRDRYEGWSKGKRIVIGLLMYLIVLPVIPIVIFAVMYIRDPQGFKKSKAMPILSAIIIAWAAAFGLVAMQPPKVTEQNNAETTSKSTPAETTKKSTDSTTKNKAQTKPDDSDTITTPSESKKKIQDKTESAASNGRTFENCDAAFDAGVFNIEKSNPSYEDRLDRDNDGIACEK